MSAGAVRRIDPDDAGELGIRLAQACAVAFVAAHRDFPHAQRVEFVRAFLATVSGMTQQAIGHQATVEAFTHVAGLRPVDIGRGHH